MKYITFCRTCNAVTGHLTNGLHSNCMKCNTEKQTPIFRWVTGIILVICFTLLALWIIYSAVLGLLGIF